MSTEQAPVIMPRQLPSDAAHFVGRTGAIGELAQIISDASEPSRLVIAVISGMAGVGKTALAVHFAYQIAPRFPDGQLYINLRGFDPSARPIAPESAVRRFLDALDVPASRIPQDPEGQTALYRSLLAERRVLVVLDNARDAAQVRPLLPGASGSMVLITSRNQLTSLAATDGACLLGLGVFTPRECRQLLAVRLGAARVAAEPDATSEIVKWCARLPLALAIVAARAAARPGFPLRTLAAELRADPLEALSGIDDPVIDMRAVFSSSYRALSPAAALVFRQFGVHHGPDISAGAAASLAGLPLPELRPLLAELARANLITEHVPGRYLLHDLLRVYASQLATSHDAADQRAQTLARSIQHYRHSATAAVGVVDPSMDLDSLGAPPAGVTPEEPASQGAALDWFAAEHPVLVAAVEDAAREQPVACVGLARALWTYLDWRGHWDDQVSVQLAGVTAAKHAADRSLEARSRRLLAGAYQRRGRLADAEAEMRHALDLHRQCQDQLPVGHALLGLAIICDSAGRHAEALSYSEQALAVYEAGANGRGQLRALNAVGWSCAQLGDYEKALLYCRQAIDLHESSGDRHGVASAWDSIGYAHYRLGEYDQAIACYGQALAVFTELGDRAYQASVLRGLGDCWQLLGETRAAHDAWRQAVTIFDELGRPEADLLRAKLVSLT